MAPGKAAVDGNCCRERIDAMKNGYRKRLETARAILTRLRLQRERENGCNEKWLQETAKAILTWLRAKQL